MLKKPKKDRDSNSQTNRMGQTGADHTLIDQGEMDRLCKGFVDSANYRKAMADPGYLREQAIFDFLTGQGYDSDTAGNRTELIRKNYYRAF